MNESRLRRFVSGLGLGYVHTCAVIVVGLWMTPFLLARLGTHDYGLWLVGGQILTYLALLDLGVVALIPREVAARTAQPSEGTGDVRELFGQTMRLVLWQLPVVALVGLLVLWLLPSEWSGLRWPLSLVVVTFVVMFPCRIFSGTLQGLQQLTSLGVSQIASWAIGAAITCGAAWMGWGLYSLAFGWAATQVGSAALCWRQLKRVCPDILSDRLPPLNIATARQYLSRSVWISVNQIAQVMLVGTDLVIIGKALGPEAVVPFACTARLVTMLANQPQMFMQTAIPALSELRASAGRDHLFAVTKSMAQVMILWSGAIVVVVLAINEPFVTWWVGESRFGGMGLTALLLATMLARHVNATATYTLFCFGNERRLALTAIADGAVSVVGMLLLVPILGLHGAALSSLVAICLVSLPCNVAALGRELGASTLDFVRPLQTWLIRFSPLVVLVTLTVTSLNVRGLWAFGALGAAVGSIYLATMLPVLRTPPLTTVLGHRLPERVSALLGLVPRGRQRKAVDAGLEVSS
jgi:O-antigen/teichoic acid export membrane protein